MSKSIKTAELYVVRPWQVVSDERINSIVTLADRLLPLSSHMPKFVRTKIVNSAMDANSRRVFEGDVHVVEFEQLKNLRTLQRVSNSVYQNPLTGAKYSSHIEYDHCIEGACYVLGDDVKGAEGSVVPFAEHMATSFLNGEPIALGSVALSEAITSLRNKYVGNAFLKLLLSLKQEITLEEIEAYMEEVNAGNSIGNESPKRLVHKKPIR